jgi:hypothetical protein
LPRSEAASLSGRFRYCESFRMPAHDGVAAHTGAGVRKPSREETAGGVARWPVRRYGIWRLSCLSSGTTFAIWHELCARVKTSFAARVISKSYALQKGHILQLVRYVPGGQPLSRMTEQYFHATASNGIVSSSPYTPTRNHDRISNRIGSGFRNCPRCRCRLAALPTPSKIERAITMLIDHRFWDMLLARLRHVRRSHRSIHCWCAHAARRSALPRERFSPLTQSGMPSVPFRPLEGFNDT